MLGNLTGWHLIIGALILIVLIVLVIVLAIRSSKKRNVVSPEVERQRAYEAGLRQAELQRAYEAGLNANRSAGAPHESDDRPA